MQEMEPPPTIKNAGDVVFPDIGLPLQLELVSLAALAWILFATALVGLAARRGRLGRAVAIYATGVLVATLHFTVLSGMDSESLVHRIGVWARYIWAPLLGSALVLALLVATLGRLSLRLLPPKGTSPITGR